MLEALHDGGPFGWLTLLLGVAAIAAAVIEAATRQRWAFGTSIGLVVGAVAVGLLGTLVGLIHSFAAVAGVDPSMKSTLLAKGISEAMNCTALGVGAVPLWLIPFVVARVRARRDVPAALPLPPRDDRSIQR